MDTMLENTERTINSVVCKIENIASKAIDDGKLFNIPISSNLVFKKSTFESNFLSYGDSGIENEFEKSEYFLPRNYEFFPKSFKNR